MLWMQNTMGAGVALRAVLEHEAVPFVVVGDVVAVLQIVRAVRGVKLAWQTVSGSDVVENFRVRVRHDFVLERVDDERPEEHAWRSGRSRERYKITTRAWCRDETPRRALRGREPLVRIA